MMDDETWIEDMVERFYDHSAHCQVQHRHKSVEEHKDCFLHWVKKRLDEEIEADILLLAMMEELGELTQAYLQYTHLDPIEPDDGDAKVKYYRIKSELHDLMALGFQLWWVLEWEKKEQECEQ